jgi:hypothetical protein
MVIVIDCGSYCFGGRYNIGYGIALLKQMLYKEQGDGCKVLFCRVLVLVSQDFSCN